MDHHQATENQHENAQQTHAGAFCDQEEHECGVVERIMLPTTGSLFFVTFSCLFFVQGTANHDLLQSSALDLIPLSDHVQGQFVEPTLPRNARSAAVVAETTKRPSIADNVTAHLSDHGSDQSKSGHHESDEDGNHEEEIEAPAILFITFTLLIGALTQLLLHKIHHHVTIPYPVILLVLGFAYGIVTSKGYGIPHFTSIGAVNPEILLLVFLPILIFEAAVNMQTHLFQKLLPHMLIIGTVGMGICLISTAYVSVGLFQSNYHYANVSSIGAASGTQHAPDAREAHVPSDWSNGDHSSNGDDTDFSNFPSSNGGHHKRSINKRSADPAFDPAAQDGSNGYHGAGTNVATSNVDPSAAGDRSAHEAHSGDGSHPPGQEDLTANNWDIHIGLLFGAVVSVTDPIAATDMLRHCGSAKSLTIVLEGTSLLSEATAVVLFNLFAKTIDPSSRTGYVGEVGYVFQVVLGGPAWGLLMGFLLVQLLSQMSNIWEAEALLVISAPYVTFWCADAVFHVSGALAVMVLGLYLSSHRACLNPELEEFTHKMWEVFSLMVNTLIFTIFGILIAQVAMMGVPADDWWKLLVMNMFILFIRGFSYFLLRPLLCHIGMEGAKTFTRQHTGVLVWTGFRGSVTLALAALASENPYLEHHPGLAEKMVFHSAGVVGFTLLLNATTLRPLLRVLGMLEMPLSKLIGINMAFQHILHVRQTDLDAMAMDRYMADADWKMVDSYTMPSGEEFGIKESDQKMIWASQFLHRDEDGVDEKGVAVQHDPSIGEVGEMENIARLRLLKAKKTSYWKQFAEGTLSQHGVEHLDDLTDVFLHSDAGLIVADDIQQYFAHEKWSGFRHRFTLFQKWVDRRRSQVPEAPSQPWRAACFWLAASKPFDIFIYCVIVLNCVETITAWILTSSDLASSAKIVFLYTNISFMVIYTAEAAIKIGGMGWKGYWGKVWHEWNRLDFIILLITYVDLILDFVAVYASDQSNLSPASIAAIRIFRFFRLVRFGRAFRLLKPSVPYILGFLDQRVNAHLYYGYDIARAYVIGQEECGALIKHIIGYTPLVVSFKTQTENDCKTISKEICMLNETRPDIAAAVKTRQAARAVLNHVIKAYEDMRQKGLLEEDDMEHLMSRVEDQQKTIRRFPYSISVMGARDRLWNVPWINGNKEILEVLKSLFQEKNFEKNDIVMPIRAESEAIYFVTNGIISLEYSLYFEDSLELGEVYNSDNLEVAFDEHLGWLSIPARVDYVLAGTMLNVQSLMLAFPRRSQAKCETGVSTLCLDLITLFKAIGTVPALEDRLWRRICMCVALNIITKQGTFLDSAALDKEKSRLARGAVRLVRPGVNLKGLDKFPEVYLITGVVTIPSARRRSNRQSIGNRGSLVANASAAPSEVPSIRRDSSDVFPEQFQPPHMTRNPDLPREVITAPRRLHASIQEIEIQKGRPAVVNQEGWQIYPEYAVLLLIPPGGHDLSTVNIHDSQLYVAAHEPEPGTPRRGSVRERRDDVEGQLIPDEAHGEAVPKHRQSNAAEIVTFVKQEERRRSRMSYNAFMQHTKYSEGQ